MRCLGVEVAGFVYSRITHCSTVPEHRTPQLLSFLLSCVNSCLFHWAVGGERDDSYLIFCSWSAFVDPSALKLNCIFPHF